MSNPTHTITWSSSTIPASHTKSISGEWLIDDHNCPVTQYQAILEDADGNELGCEQFTTVAADNPWHEELIERFGDHDAEDSAPYETVQQKLMAMHGLDADQVEIIESW